MKPEIRHPREPEPEASGSGRVHADLSPARASVGRVMLADEARSGLRIAAAQQLDEFGFFRNAGAGHEVPSCDVCSAAGNCNPRAGEVMTRSRRRLEARE